MLNSNLKPDNVYLNLAEVEFPNKEHDLPNDLVGLSKDNQEFIINWIPGENTKMMKREFPIMKFIGDDDIVMSMDDDMLLDPNHIQSRYQDFVNYGCKFAINNSTRNYLLGNTMYSKRMVKGWELFWIDEVIHSYHIDQYLNHMFYLNGYGVKPGSDYLQDPVAKHKMVLFNQINSMSQNNGFMNGLKFCELFRGIAEKMFGKSWNKLWGIMRDLDLNGFQNPLKKD